MLALTFGTLIESDVDLKLTIFLRAYVRLYKTVNTIISFKVV